MSFRSRSLAMAVVAVLGLMAGAAPAAGSVTHQAVAPQTTTVRYGPYTLPPASKDEHGSTGNKIALDVEKPCDNCFITGFTPNLVYADGSNANVNTGPMLHHAVLGDFGRRDVVCGGPRRVFSTGNERVASALPPGYGIRVGRAERWSMVYDLMNHGHSEKTVYITFTFTHQPVPGSRLKPVTPIWMDAGGCFWPVWDAPEGVSEKSRQWRSTISGRLVHMRGHVHHGGHSVRTENLTTGAMLCEIVAEEGGDPEFIDHHGHTEISDMPPCGGDPLGTINRGDLLRITSRYDLKGHAHENVMGIMVGWVAER
ncbi:hypothetical protein [Nonomuraea lactucae]|uniref:hypothetical protein n=1 Tax=Nonomuraea lactucae TaxID=2249762 RepID=UPI0013B394FF|nr:hypothetical protein [Nonomuraea lactucae]